MTEEGRPPATLAELEAEVERLEAKYEGAIQAAQSRSYGSPYLHGEPMESAQVEMAERDAARHEVELARHALEAGRDRLARLRQGTVDPLRSGRPKQQKFGILDAPNLLKEDIGKCKAQNSLFGVSALYLDIDHFKALNTRFTEREVDRSVLPALHRLIHDAVSCNGLAYAEGGDEFIVLLPNATEPMALAFAEGLRQAIASLELTVNGEQVRVTASIGVASSGKASLDDLADAANEAKRSAKDAGRDRIEIAGRSNRSGAPRTSTDTTEAP